ncbi:MAG: NfeD family protein [Phenylobacterium sp.]|jgi:membrane protein implicated in regulation of membrane protease activity|uniref:NfeD family protein n=1 Tax=Phenylobacterium sp. TaxID=1871053 RepID=UPI002A2D7BDE|nr:NfeD family protein [Phenylobacterium sp.]MDD3838011.1 NfeD family protein [Phenylobacterium sp.]MDX9999009.1 NfeD family protein [Phenylobacterium sp.]
MDLFALYGSHAFWFWLGLAAAILAVEVASGSGWLLWPAGSALAVAFLTLLIGPDPAATIAAFAVLTLVSTLLARRYLPRSVLGSGGDINDNVARLIGQEARAVAAFEDGTGRVLIDGKEWIAELEDGRELAEGQRVRVTGVRDGSRLTVRAGG